MLGAGLGLCYIKIECCVKKGSSWMSDNTELSSLIESLYPSLQFEVSIDQKEVADVFTNRAGLEDPDSFIKGQSVEASSDLFDMSYQFDDKQSKLCVVVDLDPSQKRSDFYFSALKDAYVCIMGIIDLLEGTKAEVVAAEGTESLIRFLHVCAKLRGIPIKMPEQSGVDEVLDRTRDHLTQWLQSTSLPDFAPVATAGLSPGASVSSLPTSADDAISEDKSSEDDG